MISGEAIAVLAHDAVPLEQEGRRHAMDVSNGLADPVPAQHRSQTGEPDARVEHLPEPQTTDSERVVERLIGIRDDTRLGPEPFEEGPCLLRVTQGHEHDVCRVAGLGAQTQLPNDLPAERSAEVPEEHEQGALLAKNRTQRATARSWPFDWKIQDVLRNLIHGGVSTERGSQSGRDARAVWRASSGDRHRIQRLDILCANSRPLR